MQLSELIFRSSIYHIHENILESTGTTSDVKTVTACESKTLTNQRGAITVNRVRVNEIYRTQPRLKASSGIALIPRIFLPAVGSLSSIDFSVFFVFYSSFTAVYN